MVHGQSQAVQGVAWGNGGAPQHGPSPHRGRCPSRHGAHVTNIQTPHPASAHTHTSRTPRNQPFPAKAWQRTRRHTEKQQSQWQPVLPSEGQQEGPRGAAHAQDRRPASRVSGIIRRALSQFHNTLPQSSRKNPEAQALHPGTESVWGTAWASGVFFLSRLYLELRKGRHEFTISS